MDLKIIRLPETVINQIAAGEVVENPASIVKELIENSLDAGSSHISIEIVSGGQQLIRIEDDGCGMGPEDAVLCLERHATSKIRDIEDLQKLATMGFRGEALAAISSVCHFELKTSDGNRGTRILAEGGKVIDREPCARNRGTTIEIRSLFYNVPARKKFQKSASSNASQVARVVDTVALAYPEVFFSLNGKQFHTSNRKERIEEILGVHEHEVAGEFVSGFVASPEKATATRLGQYLFINRRPIFSPLIAKAVKEGFGTRIPEHAYPRFVLFLEVSPEHVDVNVHPQKREARFRDEGKIFGMVRQAIEQTFSPMPEFREPVSFDFPSLSAPQEFPKPSFSFKEDFLETRASESTKFDFIYLDRPLTVLGNFLLLQKESLLLIDLRAAHARILFESLHFERGISQTLIFPLELELAAGEEEVAERLNELGIECRVFKKTLIIDALPPFLEAAQFPHFFSAWKEGKKLEQIATQFCRTLKKAYSLEEAKAMWQQLQKCADTLYDPMGHLIWKEIQEDDLAKIISAKSR